MSSPSNFKNRSLSVVLLAAAAISGCGKDEDTSPQGTGDSAHARSQAPDGSGIATQGAAGGAPNHPAVADWERSYEWDREQIAMRHYEIALAELPTYVEEVRGVGGKAKDGGIYGDWAFVVPPNRIAEFEAYLSELGVPPEYMNADSPFKGSERESGWRPPDPAAGELVFLRSQAARADGTRRGLAFKEGQSRIYYLDNPNLPNSELNIMFDGVTGNTHVVEKCIDW